MRRREATIALLALGSASLCAAAQTARKVNRIGFLGTSTPSLYAPYTEAFVRGLREAGYEVGRNVAIEYRWGEDREERLVELAIELVRLRPDVLVTHATGIAAAQRATSTIPIVMGASADPVGLGFVKSLAKPGGNTTGVASQLVDLSSKRLELLKEVVPALRDLAVLSPDNPGSRRSLAEIESAAHKLGVRVRAFWLAAEDASLEPVLASIVRERPQALIVQPHPVTGKYLARIAAFATSNKLPTMGGAKPFVDAGGLVSYGGDFVEGWRVAARYVDRILRGARPADLPVEHPTTFELAVNLTTAKALGLALPPSLLARNPEVVR
jgi:putative ABC transport system substrate-binding protein